jgi:hypothetical protein
LDEGALLNICLALEPKIALAQPLNLGQGREQFLLLGPSLVLGGQLGERLIRVCQEPSNSLQK